VDGSARRPRTRRRRGRGLFMVVSPCYSGNRVGPGVRVGLKGKGGSDPPSDVRRGTASRSATSAVVWRSLSARRRGRWPRARVRRASRGAGAPRGDGAEDAAGGPSAQRRRVTSFRASRRSREDRVMPGSSRSSGPRSRGGRPSDPRPEDPQDVVLLSEIPWGSTTAATVLRTTSAGSGRRPRVPLAAPTGKGGSAFSSVASRPDHGDMTIECYQ